MTRDRATGSHHRARAFLVATTLWAFALAGEARVDFDVRAALEAGTVAIGTSVSDHELITRAGDRVSVSDLRGKPVLVQPVYTSCYHSCNVLTRYLAEMVEIARDAVGDEAFHVVTVGFDTAADTPERMREFAARHRVDDERWLFLAGTPATIADLTREIGFRYTASPQGFDHLAQVTILDAEGRVYRQLYSDAFPVPALVEPLKDLVFGRRAEATTVDGWINGVKLLCTVYDPSTGAYTFDYSLFVSIAIGTLCLGGVGIFLVRAWRQHKPHRPGTRSQHT